MERDHAGSEFARHDELRGADPRGVKSGLDDADAKGESTELLLLVDGDDDVEHHLVVNPPGADGGLNWQPIQIVHNSLNQVSDLVVGETVVTGKRRVYLDEEHTSHGTCLEHDAIMRPAFCRKWFGFDGVLCKVSW